MKIALYTIESFLYFMSLSFIVERLLGGRIKRKISWGLGIALHSILIFIGIVFSYDTYTYVHVAVQVLQLSLLQLCTKNTKIVSIIGIYIGLYSINFALSVYA